MIQGTLLHTTQLQLPVAAETATDPGPPEIPALTLGGANYAADPVIASGVPLMAEIDADKSFTVSFDPATLLEF